LLSQLAQAAWMISLPGQLVWPSSQVGEAANLTAGAF